MISAREALREILQTAFRLLPWPTEPGLRSVGSPGPLSPVIVTGTYDLTVRRVMRGLRGTDAWVVVAPSRGINVWCAASGGHLTTHQVVSALRTSGVEGRVRHRRAILPQLAATGIIARDVERRAGWQVKFGPVYAEDLPRYLAEHETKTDDMRHVRFGLRERIEMAVAWAAPASLVIGGLAAALRPTWALPLIALVVILSLGVFVVYDRLPGPRRLVFACVATATALGATVLAGGGVVAVIVAGFAAPLLVGVLTFDYSGSTPIEGGSHFEEQNWHIALDLERCKGVYFCWQVCPEACFEKREDVRKVELARGDRCIRCGACVVQCPTDALAFEDRAGRRIPPDVIRSFKLNLLGQRSLDAGREQAGAARDT
jgi:NAD-dependent dihydropyrimidine dehydrogenase PreA subunit